MRFVFIVLLLGLTPGMVEGDLFYKVEKKIPLTGVAAAPDQTKPMVVTGLNDVGLMVGFFTDHYYRFGPRQQVDLHAFA